MINVSHTHLWDSVCKTDPAHTKSFSRAGGFKGTAIKPYWIVRRATEVFGPVGKGWGWKETENKVVAGVWCSKIELWYKQDGHKYFVEQWGQTVMEGTNKNGDFVDEEAPKKAVTDAVTKCLSYLGFAGDVHMGLFDDNKYVDEMKAEYAQPKGVFESAEAREQYVTNCIDAINKAESLDQIKDQRDLNAAKRAAMKASDCPADRDGFNRIVSAQQSMIEKLKPKTVEGAKQAPTLPADVAADPIPF